MLDPASREGYLWRGGQRIYVEKDVQYFTAPVRVPLKKSTEKKGEMEEDLSEEERLKSVVSSIKSTIASTEEISLDRKSRIKTFRVSLAKGVTPEVRDEIMWRWRMVGGICHYVYRPLGGVTDTRYYITNRIALKFRKEHRSHVERVLLEEVRARRITKSPPQKLSIPDTVLVEAITEEWQDPVEVANYLAKRQELEYAEVCLLNYFRSFGGFGGAGSIRRWHLNTKNRERADLVSTAGISATKAWKTTKGDPGIVVAIVDDGIDITHPAFKGKKRSPWNFAGDSERKEIVENDDPSPPRMKQKDIEKITHLPSFHGTPVAGLAVGAVGVAPDCSLMPIRIPLDYVDDYALFRIFDYAKAADVICFSYAHEPTFMPLWRPLIEKIDQIAKIGGSKYRKKKGGKGSVIVVPAGNHDAPINDFPAPKSYWQELFTGEIRKLEGHMVNGIVAHPKVIAVSASTSLNMKAFYSNWGREISVCAPSNNFHDLDDWYFKPHFDTPGLAIFSTDNEQILNGEGRLGFGVNETKELVLGRFRKRQSDADTVNKKDPDANTPRYTGQFGGTSAAAPIVTGVAALVLSVNARLTAQEVKQVLQETADRIPDYDIPKLDRQESSDRREEAKENLKREKNSYDPISGHSVFFGYGKVNAAKAVEKAAELRDKTGST